MLKQADEPALVPIRVALRIRPSVITISTDSILRTCIQVVPGEAQVTIGKDVDSMRSFTYDNVFPPTATQETVYNEIAQPLLDQFFDGFNATIIAYGQTFSGKTYTMGSSNEADTPVPELGLIPRVFSNLFKKINSDTNWDYRTKVSFLEVYQEQVRDLLAEDSRDITIRESKDGVIVVAGIQEQVAGGVEEMMRLLDIGVQERSTGDTQMHAQSSRSHAIMTITLEQFARSDDAILKDQSLERLPIRTSKLQLADLAGSERLKRTGAEGVRLRESVKINSGLLALGNVISVLGAEKTLSRTPEHVPYRDSKLTRLLQDSLGGNSKTVMIACVSPLHEDLEETLNTMKYANRARKIQNKPILNIDLKAYIFD